MSWATSQLCIGDIVSGYDEAYSYLGDLESLYAQALGEWSENDDHTAIYYLCMAFFKFEHIIEGLLVRDAAYTPSYGVPYFLDKYGGVTYQSICEAWGADDFKGRHVTIAFIDRMRQLLWDEPFDAIWAAKPEEQEIPP